MPLYEYKCHGCNKTFEVRQKFADEPLKVHEECGGEAERLISVPSLQFKGSGFYITDYGKGGGKSPASNGPNGKSESKSESSSSSDSSKSDSSKSDSSKSESSKSDSPKKESTKSESKSETKSESKPVSS